MTTAVSHSRPVAERTRITGLVGTTLRLTKSRFAARQGESLLYLAAVLAFMISSALALTVTAGTVAFFERWRNPSGILAEVVVADPSFDLVLMFYFVLALVACAMIVPNLVSLASAAAVLGARGRERRLAALRLMGLSAGDVTRMSLIDTLVQATIGTAVGLVGYLVTVPLWQNLEMQAVALASHEMLLPWQLVLGVCVAVVGLGVLSAWLGLRRVRISPLGVARRSVDRRRQIWRLIVFVLLAIAAATGFGTLTLGSDFQGYIVLVVVMVSAIAAMTVIGPLLLQQISRLIAQAPWPAVIWAARRIEANPKATWQRVTGISLLAFMGGYVALMPIELNGDSAGDVGRTFAESAQWDFTKGIIITLAIGFVLTATSILITQASAVFERAEQSIAMHKMGAPRAYGLRVMWLETMGPLVLAVTMGAALGMGLALPMLQFARQQGIETDTGVEMMVVVLITGIVLAMGALAACHPLQHQVSAGQRRTND